MRQNVLCFSSKSLQLLDTLVLSSLNCVFLWIWELGNAVLLVPSATVDSLNNFYYSFTQNGLFEWHKGFILFPNGCSRLQQVSITDLNIITCQSSKFMALQTTSCSPAQSLFNNWPLKMYVGYSFKYKIFIRCHKTLSFHHHTIFTSLSRHQISV